jgi:hypothetical protein
MKKYYALMVTVLAFIIGSTGCMMHLSTDYGPLFPNDWDDPFYDDFEETEPDEIHTDTDVVEADDYNETIMPCSETNKFCHEHDGIYWSDFVRDLIWDKSVEYCENLEGRLPTISELRTLIKDCQMIETGGACKITDECLSFTNCYDNNLCGGCGHGNYSVFGYDGTFWSSSEMSEDTNSVWVINFYNAHIFEYHTDTTQPFSAVCIKNN